MRPATISIGRGSHLLGDALVFDIDAKVTDEEGNARFDAALLRAITDQLPARLTETWATRGSRARAAASIAAHRVTFSAKGTSSSGLASV